MVNHTDDCGIKMINLKYKMMSLKIAWVKRILRDPTNTCPIMDESCKIPLDLLFKCNVKPQDVMYCFMKTIPRFWANVLTSWCEYNYKKVEQKSSHANEPLWFNSNIRIGKNTIYNKELCEKGVIYIQDLMHMGERFLTFDEILNKFKCKIPFTLYFGIIQAIPKIYKNDILSTKNIPSQLVDKLLYVEKVPKFVYNDMIKTNAPFPTKAFQKFENIFKTNMSQEYYTKAFEQLYKFTISTKLRDFQYRLLHNVLVTNEKLSKWGIQDNNLCTFCNNTPETIDHLMLTCPFSKIIWNHVFDTIAESSQCNVMLNDIEKMLGISDSILADFYNMICVTVKQYLYLCRCCNMVPRKHVAVEKIKARESQRN